LNLAGVQSSKTFRKGISRLKLKFIVAQCCKNVGITLAAIGLQAGNNEACFMTFLDDLIDMGGGDNRLLKRPYSERRNFRPHALTFTVRINISTYCLLV
jgi:hypothetical protein